MLWNLGGKNNVLIVGPKHTGDGWYFQPETFIQGNFKIIF